MPEVSDEQMDQHIDVDSVDHALTTTRAVRLRLDLEREVDNQIIYDCIDIAEQAPSGGNQGSRRWIVVRDPEMKAKLAELYMDAAGQWMIEARDKLDGSEHPQRKVMASAAHLAEHLAEVPAIVIPTVIGVHDGSGRPGLFDSVIQSVWSFCVALRARGLGTSWTTAILAKDAELRGLLGVPEANTQIAMIPVAWTKGTDFKLAPRFPARDITFIDGAHTTWQSGPSEPPSLADGPGTVAEVDIKASAAVVWKYVTDVGFPAGFSDELQSATWDEGVDGPELGATFTGTNRNDYMGEWQITSTVDRFEPHREFGWATVDVDNPGARWWFELSSIAGATRLRYRVVLGPGPSGLSAAIEGRPDKVARIIANRTRSLQENMRRVVDGVKVAAESEPKPERTESTVPLSS